MLIGDDGSVYALQRKPATIKVYGPDGTFLRDIGKEGDGPGEVRDGFLGIRGDTLLLQDPNHSRLTLFLTDGTFLKTVPSPCCYYWRRLTVDSAGRAWLPGAGNGDKASWYRVRMDGTTVDTLVMPPQEDFRKAKTLDRHDETRRQFDVDDDAGTTAAECFVRAAHRRDDRRRAQQ